MGPEDLRAEYWQITTAAFEVLRAWDAQQEDADGDWGAVFAAMEHLRTMVFGEKKKGADGREADPAL